MKSLLMLLVVFMALFTCIYGSQDTKEGKDEDLDPDKAHYTKGSICEYCKYKKFCKLCKVDCPCEGRPACHMCKYCKFCPLAKVCDAICQPGGFIDKVTATLINSLPTFSKTDVDADINSVEKHINEKKDEL